MKLNNFYDVCSQYCFYHGFSRYSQFKGHHVFVCTYGFFEHIRNLADNLDSHDEEALGSAKKLYQLEKNGDCFIESHDNPSVAMSLLFDKIINQQISIREGLLTGE